MPSDISRHTSTVSLISQASVHAEAGFLVQSLNRYRDVLESGCDRILEFSCSLNKKTTTPCSDSVVSSVHENQLFASSCDAEPSNGLLTQRRLDPKARESLGQHLIELLATIVLPDPPQSINEVDAKLAEGLPSIPDKMMPNEFDSERFRLLAIKRRKGLLHLPAKEVHAAFKEFNERFNFTVTLYILAVAEHILTNFLQTAICYEEKALTEDVIRASTIDTLFQIYRDRFRTRRKTNDSKLTSRFPQDYDKCVDELDDFLRVTLEHLNLLLRIFREPVVKSHWECGPQKDNAFTIFGSLLDLYNNMRVFADTLNAEEGEDIYQSPLKAPHLTEPTTPLAEFSDSSFSLRTHPTLSQETTGEPAERFVANTRWDQRHRLVGICLIELAEDDSLHTFSHYASCVLNALSHDCTWMMIENANLVQTLCRLSRVILYTVSLTKPCGLGSNTTVSYPNSWPDIHSFICKRCQFWDSVPVPRRRSTSSAAASHQSSKCESGSESLMSSHSKTLPKHQRSSNSSSALDEPLRSSNCNYLVNSFKYLLPRLLLIPIFQFFYLHELIKTLHHCAYDEDDRARLKEVLSMLSKTRSNVDRELSRHPWIFVHLTRLLSTGYLIGQHRSLYLDLLSTSPAPSSPTSFASLYSPATSPKPSGSIATVVSLGVPDLHKGNSFGFPPSLTDSDAFSTQCHKLDEIERLLGSKGKLSPVISPLHVGEFVMESRIHLSTENKRTFSEHVAYLFSGVLLICKWQERRSAFSSSSGANMVLRMKHHIALESIHVSDIPPIVQPNLFAYVGNSGSVTSSAVDAAVQAVSASQCTLSDPSNRDSSNNPYSGSSTGSLSGSMSSQSTLTITAGSTYPYMFELEYSDPVQLASVPSGSGHSVSAHRPNCPHHMRHLSPQKPGVRTMDTDFQHISDSPDIPISVPDNVESNSACACLSDGVQLHRLVIAVRTPEEKADWMASLLSIKMHRLFLRYIRTLPKLEVPLRLPSPAIYRFCQPDMTDTIIFESKDDHCSESIGEFIDSFDSSEDGLSDDARVSSDSDEFFGEQAAQMLVSRSETILIPTSTCGKSSDYDVFNNVCPKNNAFDTLTPHTVIAPPSTAPCRSNHDRHPVTNIASNQTFPVSTTNPPTIRLATVDKLIERLTYPTYFDARLVNMFLLMYRRVLTSEEFLRLLIERFRIPDPEFLPEELLLDVDKGQLESPAQHMLKRFRSSFKKRVQARVIMLIYRWVRTNRYYQVDFASNPELRHLLSDFLNSIQTRCLTKSVRRILQHMQAHTNDPGRVSSPRLKSLHPTECDHITEGELAEPRVGSPRCFSSVPPRLDITSIHPNKLAEQVTLYEWELYRSIHFWEVEGRNRLDSPTPNLDRSKQFSNRFRNWLVYLILSEPHPADRVVVIQRVIDLMLMMERVNNLQGCQEAKSALISAAVYRLRKSFNSIRRCRHYRDIVDRLRRESTVSSGLGHKGSVNSSQSTCSFGFPAPGSPSKPSDHLSPWSKCPSNPETPVHKTNNTTRPFAGSLSKSHERRFNVLAKQQAAGVSYRPCVPFIAAGVMTRLIHLDVRYPDTVKSESGAVLVNCWKFNQMAEVIERYLAFQRIPYMFTVDHDIRNFLESLDPLALAHVSSESEFESRMYELSELYEPREIDANVEASSAPSTVERRLSKEAIQAAALLSSISLKERMSFQTMFSFANLLSYSAPVTSGFSSRILTPVQSGAICMSSHNLTTVAQSKSSSDSHEAGSSPHPRRRYLPSPIVSTAITDITCIHQHSVSDSQVVSSTKRATATANASVYPNNPSPHQTTSSFGDMNISHVHSYSQPPNAPSQGTDSSQFLPPPLPPRKLSSGGSTQSPNTSSCSSSLCLPASRFLPKINDTSSNAVVPPPLPPKRISRPSTIHADSKDAVPSLPEHSLCNAFTFVTDPSIYNTRCALTGVPPPVPPRRLPKTASELCSVNPIPDSVKSPVPPT